MGRLEPREYSKRLGVLAHPQLQAALDRFDLGELRSAEPAVTGLFGQNVLLDTSRGRFVLRGHPHTSWQLEQERHFAKLIHEGTRVPAPWPYEVDDSEEIFGWPYALMPRLPGNPPQALWAQLGPTDRCEIAEAMGAALGDLQEIEAPGCGVWDPELGGIRLTRQPFSEWAPGRVRELLLEARGIPGALSNEDLEWAEQLIADNGDALRVEPTPTLLHNDYAPGNVVVTRDPRWQVTGVFDLQETRFGDPEEDLSRSVAAFAVGDAECARRFVGAYRLRRPLRPGHAQRFRLYMLRDRLGIWIYARRNRLWFGDDASFQGFARRFVELDVF